MTSHYAPCRGDGFAAMAVEVWAVAVTAVGGTAVVVMTVVVTAVVVTAVGGTAVVVMTVVVMASHGRPREEPQALGLGSRSGAEGN